MPIISRRRSVGLSGPGVPVATHLAFTAPPGLSGVSPYTLSPQPVVAAQNAGATTDTTYVGTVTITLNVLTGSPVLSGTTTKALVLGVADFSGNALVVTGAGTWTLTATLSGLTAATSNTGTTTSTAATHLTITTQPVGSTTPNLATQPVVAAQNAGNATDTSYVTTVVPTLNVITGSATLGGSEASGKACVAGVATFTNLTVTAAAGATWTITFTSGSLTSATSSTGTTTASGGTLPLGDDFTDTDGTTLDAHVPSGTNHGTSWTMRNGASGNLKIRNGEVYATVSSFAQQVATLNGAAAYGTNDYTVAAPIRFAADPSGDQGTFVAARVPSTGHGGYVFGFNYTDKKWKLIRLGTPGDTTDDLVLAATAATTYAAVVGTTPVVSIQVAGSTITCQIDGVNAFAPVTDSTYATGDAGLCLFVVGGINPSTFGFYPTAITVTP